MSYLDLEKLAPEDLILHYVLECRGQGLFLPYQDYQIIEEWLSALPDTDELLLVLSEVLPEFFAGEKKGRSLAGCRKLVLSRLKDRAMRQPVE
jgi:hypothetical protein